MKNKTLFIVSILVVLSFAGKVKAEPYTDIDVHQAYNMITSGSYPNLLILDVRTENEFDEMHIANAILIPHTELEERINELAGHENHEVIIYCNSGYRSTIASQILDNHGFTKVYNMVGGITAWTDADYPVRITGDVNGDGKVDASDLNELSKAYGCTPENPNWNPDCNFNFDYIINIIDLKKLGKNYRKTNP